MFLGTKYFLYYSEQESFVLPERPMEHLHSIQHRLNMQDVYTWDNSVGSDLSLELGGGTEGEGEARLPSEQGA